MSMVPIYLGCPTIEKSLRSKVAYCWTTGEDDDVKDMMVVGGRHFLEFLSSLLARVRCCDEWDRRW
jgi:hypothetical protein